MKTTLLAACALSASVLAAAADPVRLTDSELDQVSAGVLDNNLINLNLPVVVQPNVPISVNLAAAIGVLAENISAGAVQDVDSGNLAEVTNALLGD